MNKKKILSLLLAGCMLVGMVPAALAEGAAEAATKTCTIAQDTGKTGTPTEGSSSSPVVQDNTITFSGAIPYYEAKQDGFPPVSGNYIGVRIVSAEDAVPGNNAKITITEVNGTDLDGDYNVDLARTPEVIAESSNKAGIQFWPLIKSEDMLKDIKFSVDWDGEGNDYQSQEFTIKFATGTTLAKPETAFVIARDPGNTGGSDCQAAPDGSDSTTIKFTGAVDFYKKNSGFPPEDGNYIGVQINVKDDNQFKTPFWFQIPGHEVYGSSWTKAEEDGASKLWFYPALSATASDNKFEILVSASEAGSFPTKFTIDATSATLKASPANVALSTGKNLSGIGMDAVTGSVAEGYKVAITGTEVVPGLEALKDITDVYNDFNPSTGSTWGSVPAEAKNSDFTIVSLDFPAAPNASGIEIKQSSKALKAFYCADKTAGQASALDSRIVVDTGAETATKTHTYNADANGKIWMDFIMMKGDTVTFTVKHSNDLTVTYEVTANGLNFKKPDAVKAPGFAISTSESILTKKASDLMLNAALTPDSTKDNTYLVTGTAKYVENWTEFDGTLHTGHYLALTVTKPDNLPANANYTVTAKGNQEITFDKDHFFTEGSSKDTETFVMYLDKLTDGKFTLAFDWDGDGTAEAVTYTFDVSGMSMPEKDAIVVAPPTVTGTKAEVKVTESDITDAIAAAVPTTSPAPGTALEPVIVIDSTKNDSGATITTATEAKVTLPKESVAALKTASDTENDLTVNIATPVGTIEVGKDVLAVLEAAAISEDINLNMEKVTSSLPADAEGDQVYEVNFQTASGAPVEVPSANLILTLRFSNITDPSAVKITSDKNSSERIVPERFTAVPGETNTYDFTFKVTHLTLFYATTATTPTPTTGTVTKTESSDSNLGKTIKFTVAGAGSSITNAYLTVDAKRGSGTNAVNFCTVVPVTLTSGAGSDVAELYFQNDVTITGAWVTENKPTLTNGAPISGSILASLQP